MATECAKNGAKLVISARRENLLGIEENFLDSFKNFNN